MEKFCVNALEDDSFSNLNNLINYSLDESSKEEIKSISKSNDWLNNYNFQINFIRDFLLNKNQV